MRRQTASKTSKKAARKVPPKRLHTPAAHEGTRAMMVWRTSGQKESAALSRASFREAQHGVQRTGAVASSPGANVRLARHEPADIDFLSSLSQSCDANDDLCPSSRALACHRGIAAHFIGLLQASFQRRRVLGTGSSSLRPRGAYFFHHRRIVQRPRPGGRAALLRAPEAAQHTADVPEQPNVEAHKAPD